MAALIERDAKDYVDLLVRESGSTRPKAEGEHAATMIEFYQAAELAVAPSAEVVPSGQPGRVNIVERRPVGVVGLIAAWNAPLHIAARILAPALGLGNAVLVKPAPQTPIVGGLRIAATLREAGVPEGLVGVLPGDSAGPALVTHPGVEMIHFTGSEGAGRAINIAAAPLFKRVALEQAATTPPSCSRTPTSTSQPGSAPRPRSGTKARCASRPADTSCSPRSPTAI